ncbi:Peptidase family M49 [Owenweeksia hongkongensis DSM 17368]|uniref:Peptidase family M49 n=1 Tax=Owenweeksia hongkongensis (strain DSM 17368 / CIP 108786 / JCM 12287 / NRRL B-23963 / UST20020801) TaxID=926562 RepID=G8R244_OWEHD|nr:dihydrofolate reductase [Owenweeksia hongkongensis]AEV31794.1 Peptidase family M49 [Owenweeksia hongkongensis DSM 17368]
MKRVSLVLSASIFFMSCNQQGSEPKEATEEVMNKDSHDNFQWETEQFADLRILRYQIEGWDNLSLKQKELVYYLTQAGLSGRDITWDQYYRHNLEIRNALEAIVKNYNGDKESEDWKNFMTYTKRVWFSNGIHHHYSNAKMKPGFEKAYFEQLLSESNTSLSAEATDVIFNDKDMKKVSKDSDQDLLLASAVNFYDPDITEEEAIAFYKKQIDPNTKTPISYGLNSKLVRAEDGSIKEVKWSAEGMYGSAITEIIGWLEKAQGVAENEAQGKALGILIDYYKTGDLKKWDEYNIAWVEATEGDIDYINSFIEVYDDPLGYKATYETVVQIKDFDASKKMAVISDNIQYFEDNSPIMDEHKKPNVKGVTYKMVNVAGEAGATTPSTPIGVNLPNANWIRAEHGSKSVSLANIEHAYEEAKGAGFLEEFTFTKEELERAKKYAGNSSKMHTALHEVVGHASGKLNDGVGTPKETLRNYASTLEEGRADLVALYYIMDPKLMEMGLIDTMEVGKAEYDNYIRNGLMLQLRRLEVGEIIEEDHMRNRQLVAKWAYETGKEDNIIEKKTLDGKTYFVINDYDKLREIFGDQLREIQRIKSEGDYEAGKKLVETYGVQVDPAIHKEVLARTEKLHIAPYNGFIQPELKPVMEGDSIKDIEVIYPTDFTQQMLMYGEKYSFLK